MSDIAAPDWAQGRLRAYWEAGVWEMPARTAIALVDQYGAKGFPITDAMVIRVMGPELDLLAKSLGGTKGSDGNT